MIKELRSMHCDLTPAIAAEHSTLPQINGDRSMQKERVAWLKEIIGAGLFHSPEWAVAYIGGKKIRINGKHSSSVLAAMNGDFPTGLQVTIKQFSCDDETDLATLFDQFDSRRSVRTRGDSMNVHKHLQSALEELSTTAVLKIMAGVTWYLRQEHGLVFGEEESKQLIHEHVEFIRFAGSFCGTRRIGKAGVLAAMFAIFTKAGPAPSRLFWDLVSTQGHESPKNATRILGKFLEICVFDVCDPNTKRKWDTRALYSKCIHGWNAYRRGVGTDLKYHATSPLPKPVG